MIIESKLEVSDQEFDSELGTVQTVPIPGPKGDPGEKGEKGDKGDKGDPGVVKFTVVKELPEQGADDAIYLVPVSGGTAINMYDEYIFVDGVWEKIGSTAVEVDLTDYVKNTDYATKDGATAGVVRVRNNNYSGLRVNANGELAVYSADKGAIDAKSNDFKPIVPLCLDYAVKKGLTDNKETWTEEDKAKARNLIGVAQSTFVTPQQFGAKGDGVTDDTAAIQAATDYAYANNIVLHFPSGQYKITSPIDCHSDNCWIGENHSRQEARTVILTYVEDDAVLVCNDASEKGKRTFKGIYFRRMGSKKNTLFGLFFAGGLIEGCNATEYGVIFGGNVRQVTTVTECRFTSIMTAFATANISDTRIYNNYISGYRSFNPVCFAETSNMAHSLIKDNFFDYFKAVFKGAVGDTIITSNTFDYVYRAFDPSTRSQHNLTISNNSFLNISNSITNTDGFIEADAEMLAIEPMAIFSAKTVETNGSYEIAETYYGITRSVITGNFFGDAKICFFSPCNGVTLNGNSYFYGASDITFRFNSDSTQKYRKCYVDILENSKVDTLPVWYRSFAYPWLRVLYNNKLVTYVPNDWPTTKPYEGVWYDAMGNEVTV